MDNKKTKENEQIEKEILAAMNNPNYTIIGIIKEIAVLSRTHSSGEVSYASCAYRNGRWERGDQAWGCYKSAIIWALNRVFRGFIL